MLNLRHEDFCKLMPRYMAMLRTMINVSLIRYHQNTVWEASVERLVGYQQKTSIHVPYLSITFA